MVERIAEAFEMFLDRHGHFFRTRTRHNVAVARRYLRGLAQAEGLHVRVDGRGG